PPTPISSLSLHDALPIFANPSIKGALIERLVDAAKKIKVGSGLDDTVDMGPAVDEKQWKTDLDYIKLGQQEGARLVLGAKRPEQDRKSTRLNSSHLVISY